MFKSANTMKYILIVLLLLPNYVFSGPLAYAGCQTTCNLAAVACYSAAGLTFGTITLGAAATGPLGWGAWIASFFTTTSSAAAACSAAQGVCMATICAPLLIAPTP